MKKKLVSTLLALVMLICLLPASAMAVEDRVLEDALEEAEEVQLPLYRDYELGSEGLIGDCYGFAVKVNLEANSAIELIFTHLNDEDVKIKIYQKSGETFNKLAETDIHYSEEEYFVAPETDYYYILFAGNYHSITGTTTAEINLLDAKFTIGSSLDFNTNPALTPSEGELWAWDSATKTLTLKDGFSLACSDGAEGGIILPENSTIIVEGTASLIASTGDDELPYGILYNESLTIKGNGTDSSVLNVFSLADGIHSNSNHGIGLLTLGDITLNIYSHDDGLQIGGGTIKNAKLNFTTWNECIYSPIDEEGSHSLTIENCELNFQSLGEEGFDINDNSLIITGGKLNIDADEDGIEAGRATLTNVTFDIKNSTRYLIHINNSEGFSLPGTFRLYDIDGNQIYEGEWNSDLIREIPQSSSEDKALYVGETQVCHAVSVPQEQKPEEEKDLSPQTGDSSEIIYWVALFLVGGGIAVAAKAIANKKNKNK